MAYDHRAEGVHEVGSPSGDGARRQPAPETTEEARRAIEQTRGRISVTLDTLEDRLQEKREALSERLDVLRPVRNQIRMHVWPSLALGFGAGFLLAGIGGGEEGGRTRGIPDEEERRELRRWRAERRARLASTAAKRRPRRGRNGSVMQELRSALTDAIVGGLQDRMRRPAA